VKTSTCDTYVCIYLHPFICLLCPITVDCQKKRDRERKKSSTYIYIYIYYNYVD